MMRWKPVARSGSTNVALALGVMSSLALAVLGCSEADDPQAAKAARVEALAEQVIADADDAASRHALGELSAMGPDSSAGLRRAFQESSDAHIRAKVAEAMADADAVAAVPDLLDALDDDDENVRRSSAAALEALICVSVRYDAHAPPEERRAAIQRYRSYWNRRNTPEMNAIGKDPQKAKKTMQQQTIFE